MDIKTTDLKHSQTPIPNFIDITLKISQDIGNKADDMFIADKIVIAFSSEWKFSIVPLNVLH
jgi:hypothetical protein